MKRWWMNLSVVHKLYTVVGIMVLLITSELFTLFFAIHSLSSLRAFVAGEGLWSKAQKDAIYSLFQFAERGENKYFEDFRKYLEIPAGNHLARIELLKPNYDIEVVRRGFLQGGNHPSDINGMIDLLVRFQKFGYMPKAFEAWTAADVYINELRQVADEIYVLKSVSVPSKDLYKVRWALSRVVAINTELTKIENDFSASLGAGSRWLESVLIVILGLTVLTIESTGIYMTFRFSRNLSLSLKELRDTAIEVGKGRFSVFAPIRSADELGQLAEALNGMISDLKASVAERREAETLVRRSEERYRILNSDLERRVEARTRELQRRESQLRQITNAVPVLLAQVDLDERILFANQPFCESFGSRKAAIIGQTLAAIVDPVRYHEAVPHIQKALTGEWTSFEHVTTPRGTPVVYGITLVPEFDDLGAMVGFIIVANDVTHFKEIEAELKSAKETADIASDTKSAFLANMSHEIRTPLGAILGFSELLLGRDITLKEEELCVEGIKRNGNVLTTIINDILDLSKVEAGKLEVELTGVPFEEIEKEVSSLLNLVAAEKGLTLKVHVEGNVPAVVKTDIVRLRQILLNLVGNAIKFTDRGSVEVAIKTITNADGSSKLGFFVSDTGRGISKEQESRLFQPFTQADVSTTRKFGGTGLGLVLSRKLAHALGGDVVLGQSTAGVGSTFIATIDPGSEMVAKETSRGRALAPSSSTLSGLRVLLAEDSVDNQIIVSHFLRKTGVALEVAQNGREALDKAMGGDFDIVLMDLQMPVMDGYEAVNQLRALHYSRPILALTAHAMKEERRWCLDHGFDSHLSKPLTREVLIKELSMFAKL